MSTCDDMKDCPFCGKKPWRQRVGMSEVYAYADKVIYTCSGCGITRGAMGDVSKAGYADNSTVEARAFAAWNMRPAEEEALRKDAERYRFFRDIQQVTDNGDGWSVMYLDNGAGGFGGGVMQADFTDLDEAVDFAISVNP